MTIRQGCGKHGRFFRPQTDITVVNETKKPPRPADEKLPSAQCSPTRRTASPSAQGDPDASQQAAASDTPRQATSREKGRTPKKGARSSAAPTKPAAKTAAKKKKRSHRKKKKSFSWPRVLLLGLEGGALLCFGVTILMVALGYAAEHLSGTNFLYNLLPFALAALATTLAGMFFLRAWGWLRRALARRHAALAPLLALIACIALWSQNQWFVRPLEQFRLLVGGKTEIHTLTMRHQTFAAYRRLEGDAMAKMFLRAQAYATAIEAAARAFDLDPDLLNGLAAAESSFSPRTSADGGQGLFQLTSIPDQAQAQALKRLGKDADSPDQHRRQAFIAAATLRHYLTQMNGNTVLGLLAYNIGPANGGLRHIMQRYSATDFISIQPYLQEKPRNYPIRVLAYALAFRVNRTQHRLLPYEEGLNAIRVQHIGIPGL